MRYNFPLLAAGLMLTALSPSDSKAADNTWLNTSGNFLWDLTSANWSAPTVWSDGNNAVFGSTGVGPILLAAPITVENQTFNAAGYTIDGGGNTMTLTGAASITVNADSTNQVSLTGTNGLTVKGSGVLTIKGDPGVSVANSYTGGTFIKSGTLVLSAPSAVNNGSAYAVDSIESLDAGATLKFDPPFNGTAFQSYPHQIGIHNAAIPSRLHLTGGTFDLNNDPKAQHIPPPDGDGLIINSGTTVQAGLIMVADGKDHEFSGVIADGGPLIGDNSAQGPGRQIGIISFASQVNGGGGVLTLSGPNTYSGSTRIDQGASIKLKGRGTLGFPTPNGLTGPLRVYGPGYLDLNGTDQTIALMTSGNAAARIFNSAPGTISTLTFGYGNEQVATRNAGMQFIDNPGTGGILAMKKIGATCIQTLSGINTYSGDTTVAEGTLAFANPTAVSPKTTFRLVTGATVALNFDGSAPVKGLFINGVAKPPGTYGAETAPLTGTGTLTVTGPKVWNNGAGNFLWDLTSANWSQSTWVDGEDAVFGSTGVGTVTLATPISVRNQTFNAAGYTIDGAGGNIMTLDGAAPSITVNADSTNQVSLSGTNGLTIQGSGVLTLKGDPTAGMANTYTGGTYVKSGTLVLSALPAVNNGSSYAVDSIESLDAGATLKFDPPFNGTAFQSYPHQIGIHNTAIPSRLHLTGGTFDLNNDPKAQHIPPPDGHGLIINSGTTVQAGLIMVADGKDHEFSGVIADGGPLIGDNSAQGPGRQIGIISFASQVNGGGGVLTLSGPNTYSGSTRIDQGASIKLKGQGTLGSPTPNSLTGPLRVYGPGYLDLNGTDQTIALMTSGNAAARIFNSATGSVSTLTFGYGNEQVATRNAGMQYIDNPGVGGLLAMKKIGATCIQTLSGINTYSGDTTLAEGTLAFANPNAVSPNSAFRLAPGANLALNYEGAAPVRQLFINGVQKPNGTYGAETPPITGTGSLTVTGFAPVTITVTKVAGALSLSWEGVYRLQSATAITGPWTNYPGGGMSPATVTPGPTPGAMFFKLAPY